MPKIYYRCHLCHKEKINECWCNYCNRVTHGYKCQHDYWYERLYLTIRDFIRNLRRG